MAFLAERSVPADEDELDEFARELLDRPPERGYLTLSRAPQWRLTYRRIVQGDVPDVRSIEPG